MTRLGIRIRGRDLPGLHFGAAGLSSEPVHVGVQREREVVDLVAAGDQPEAVFDLDIDIVTRPDGAVDFRGP